MEGERRKRKLEKEEESEEQQMEKFFALIKSTKDVRDRMSTEKKEEKAKGHVWNPKFQLEDFVDEEDLARIDILRPPAAGPSGKERKEEAVGKELAEATAAAAPLGENEDQKKAESDNLDLTLSL